MARYTMTEELWDFYPLDDTLVFRRAVDSIPGINTTYVSFTHKDGAEPIQNWSEVVLKIVGLGFTYENATEAVAYLQKGGDFLVLNLYANSITAGDKVLQGPMTGFHDSIEQKEEFKKGVEEYPIVKKTTFPCDVDFTE